MPFRYTALLLALENVLDALLLVCVAAALDLTVRARADADVRLGLAMPWVLNS